MNFSFKLMGGDFDQVFVYNIHSNNIPKTLHSIIATMVRYFYDSHPPVKQLIKSTTSPLSPVKRECNYS